MGSKKLTVATFFAGVGGLDTGFHQAGYQIVWANEYDKKIFPSYKANFPSTELDTRSIANILATDIPDVDGIIGGPPCQSWSEAGARRGIDDSRGILFFDYLRIVKEKRPLFFVAENVSGILFEKHKTSFHRILSCFSDFGYNVSFGLINANNYGVAQDRERVFIVGYQTHVGKFFTPPEPAIPGPVLRDVIWDLRNSAKPARDGKYANSGLQIPNHEYAVSGFSSMFMSRNRVRSWGEPSFTIQASARHAPLHPQAPKMLKVEGERDRRIFKPGSEHLYRRLTIREAARIQAFPDDYVFLYENVEDGYRMAGNAVPTELARRIGIQISSDLAGIQRKNSDPDMAGRVLSYQEVREESSQ